MTVDAHNLNDTERIASDVARLLRPGDCVALDGDLGAGKTTFSRGLVAALGGDPRQVSSPTFVLLHTYDASVVPVVHHLDAYRVGGADDLAAIGFDELLDGGGVVVVEWAARVADLLPPDRLDVRIERLGETARRFTIERRP